MFFDTGLPPFALLKCLQSGENHANPTRSPFVTFTGIDAEDVFAVVLRRRVVRGVHRDGFRVVIDRDVNRAADRRLNAGARPSSTPRSYRRRSPCRSCWTISRVIQHPRCTASRTHIAHT
jgi:hypothetical protein